MPTNENNSWRQTLIQSKSTIKDAIKSLNSSSAQIALVVEAGDELLGTVTDGDVRRALLRGVDINSSVSEIMFTSPMVVTKEMGKETVLHLMRANKIHQFPVVDENRKVIGLHVWDDIIAPTSRDNTVVIMAGGFGTRLRPYTEDCPKPMLPVAGKPMLEHIIERAKNEGFHNFVLSIHYLGHIIEEYFGNGSKFGINIRYLKEESPLGTAGALSLLESVPELPFIVTNGDVLTDVRYGEMLDFHIHHNADATMAVRQHEWQHPFGVVRTKGIEIISFEEKPVNRTHVNAGIYVLNPSSLKHLPRGQRCDMPTLFEIHQRAGEKTIAYPMHEPWLDVGRIEDLEKANQPI